MTRYGVNSVTDEDLERFKAESPADFVRMSAAGIEGAYALVDQLQRNSFFYDQNLRFYTLYWLSTIGAHGYVIASGDPNQVNAAVDAMNKTELSIGERDFTGFDMAAWAYDLFRPDTL
jgi:hypothetical protein